MYVYICTQLSDERSTPSVTFQKPTLKVLACQYDSLINSKLLLLWTGNYEWLRGEGKKTEGTVPMVICQ